MSDRDKELVRKIAAILSGIDKYEGDDYNGWWETPQGAEFGAKKLAEILALFQDEPYAEIMLPDTPENRRLMDEGGKWKRIV